MKKFVAIVFDENTGKFKNISIKAKDEEDAQRKAEGICKESEHVEDISLE